MILLRPLVWGLAAPLLIAGCISPELRTARIALNERDWNRAMNSLDAELARMPGSPEPLFLKGTIYEQMGEWREMSLSYDACLKASDQFASQIQDNRKRLVARFLKGSLEASDSSRWTLSLALVDTAIIIDPGQVSLYQHAAVTAYNADKFDRAIEYGLEAVAREETGKKDLPVREVLVASYGQQKDRPNARKWASDVMSLADPAADSATYLRAHDAIVEAQEAVQDYDGAIATIKEAASHFPNRPDIKMNLALMMLRKKDYDGAKAVYQDVLKLAPDNFDANLNLGTILVNQDKWVESIPYLVKAHELEPLNVTAVTNLMAAYYNDNQDAKGKEMKLKLDALKQGQ